MWSVNGSPPDTNEGLIGQLFGQNLQSFPESTCQVEYMDILGGDMNDGRLPGQRTRWRRKKTCHYNLEISLSLSCWSGHPSSVRKDVKIRRAATSLLGIGDCALMIGSHDPKILLFLQFLQFFLSHTDHPVITHCSQYTGYCWLKRSDGLRNPHPKIIIGPKFCAPTGGIIPIDAPSAREPCAVTVSQEQVLSINL